MGNPPFWTAFLEPENLVTDRSALFGTDMSVRCNNLCGKIDTQNNFSSCSGCFTTAYCSQECQEAYWQGDHRTECKALKALRGGSRPVFERTRLRLCVQDRYRGNIISRRRDEVVQVWKAEMPPRTAVASLD
ncbi:hypothetical protein C8J57DRAFT_1544502 [Mycena rebaudengoi]|nr:hypothetical protein C8J57DRAFT_1544502 [Mycena rebaudengoi]